MQLVNRRPVVIQVQARRVADVPIFATPPLQSDYVADWDQAQDAPPPGPRGWRRHIADRLSPGGQMALMLDVLPLALRVTGAARRRAERRERSFANERWYRRVR